MDKGREWSPSGLEVDAAAAEIEKRLPAHPGESHRAAVAAFLDRFGDRLDLSQAELLHELADANESEVALVNLAWYLHDAGQPITSAEWTSLMELGAGRLSAADLPVEMLIADELPDQIANRQGTFADTD